MKKLFIAVAAELERFFAEKPIVLFDVGASGAPPEAWRELSTFACYVGFDPDLRELHEDNSFGFRRFIMFNKAVTETAQKEIKFYLTASPFCASTLKPIMANLCQYSFAELFHVEKTTSVPSTDLGSALHDVGLDQIDWLKIDSQGKDLDIYRSLDLTISNRLLVLDVEPGFMNFYEGENTFTQAHEYLVRNDYWLSKADIQRYPRISKSTQNRFAPRKINVQGLPGAPTAIEAQYFRTLGHLTSIKASLRDYVCLWVFSVVNKSYGFALDIAAQVAELNPNDNIGDLLVAQTLEIIDKPQRPRATLKDYIPAVLHPLVRRIVGRS